MKHSRKTPSPASKSARTTDTRPKVKDLLGAMEAFEATPESVGHGLRLDLADIILSKLKEKAWTQKRLAEAVGVKESLITRIIHAKSNCTFDVAGRILFAVGAIPQLIERRSNARRMTSRDKRLAAVRQRRRILADMKANLIAASREHARKTMAEDERDGVWLTKAEAARLRRAMAERSAPPKLLK